LEKTSNPTLHTYQICPVCQSPKIGLVLSAEDYTVSREKFEIWHCQNCQLRFTQHVPDESTIGPYYQSEEYVSHSNTSQGLINQLYQVVRNITLKQKRRLVEKVSGRKQGRLLDIGCGTGEFLGTMKNAGWDTLGLEPDEGARNMALSQQGVEVHEPDHLFALPESDFDVISMWHVLEHVHRLHEYLDQIRKIIKEEGTLLIAVPNYHSKDAENYQAEWAAYDVPRHLYHFSATTMGQLLAQHGFRLESLQHMPFDAFYVSMLSEKYRHGKTRLFSAFWQGLKSYMTSRSKPERGSSILYLVKPV
jgi:SAM-dependent methyltransferase